MDTLIQRLGMRSDANFWDGLTADLLQYQEFYDEGKYSSLTDSCSGYYEGQEEDECYCSSSLFYAEQIHGLECDSFRIIYWYHPDYLGHNEFITDKSGKGYQYFHYSAFGEVLVQKDVTYGKFDSPWRFNGKEADSETGNYYYGARYYDPELGVWISVDKLSDQFAASSVYNFVEGNPINLKDPDGNAPQGGLVYGFNANISIGSNFKLNYRVGGSIGYHVSNSSSSKLLYLSGSIYKGGIGTSKNTPVNWDLNFGAYSSIGSGKAHAHAINDLNSDSYLPISNTFNESFGIGFNFTYNYGINKNSNEFFGGIQQNMFNNIRFGSDFSITHSNDGYFNMLTLKLLGKNIDAGNTGSLTMNIGNDFRIAYQQFTGRIFGDKILKNRNKYYRQTGSQMAFNLSQFLIERNGVRLSLNSKPYLQNGWHYLLHNSKFWYNNLHYNVGNLTLNLNNNGPFYDN